MGRKGNQTSDLEFKKADNSALLIWLSVVNMSYFIIGKNVVANYETIAYERLLCHSWCVTIRDRRGY
ncbi:hypothetical protein EDB95_1549 [Dinghuibacter silviterrae]|uniref:Uncharacterized protein n=1 Tax=Dinghuibacter silviterrae TaxID=1539049 RepID=A0A4R8DQT9_9BACT|nr:hypothetical protein EDB95_1549 [Dinghuibacter silviterrae]